MLGKKHLKTKTKIQPKVVAGAIIVASLIAISIIGFNFLPLATGDTVTTPCYSSLSINKDVTYTITTNSCNSGRYPKFKTRCLHDIMGMKGENYAQRTPVSQ